MNNIPTVSVLMTAYNREQFIGEAIESVLASSYDNFELIIVDDCSTDATVSVARKYTKDPRVHVYVNEKNLGDYPNRNKCASYAKGKFLKYQDSDDIMYPHCLQVMAGAMEKFPSAGFGLIAIPDPVKPYPICIQPKEIYLEHFYGYGHFDRAPYSAIIKREVFEKEGGFSGKRMIGDYEFWIKLSRSYPMVKLPRDLGWDRQHDAQESRSDYARKYDLLKKEILTEAFKHPGCPLTAAEKKKVLQRIRTKKYKTMLKKLF